MIDQFTPQAQHRQLYSPRRRGAAASLSLACLLVLLPGCISASAPKTAATLNGEAMYAPVPWASSKPVNITARVSAVQGALNAVQAASNSYVQYQQIRADTHNQQQARISAYKSHQYHQRLRAEEDRLRAIREREAAMPRVVTGKPQAIVVGPIPEWDSTGWDLGVAVAGWVGMQDAQLRQMRVDINTNMISRPPPPPPNRKGNSKGKNQ